MAEVLLPQLQQSSGIKPVQLPHHNKPRLPPTTISIPQSASAIRNGHLNLGVFSPVNQNGSFEFDRVLRSGEVYKRTRKTKQWKKFYLVLRPNLLSIYKSASEEKLLKQINLSDLTAVAYQKDPRGRRENIFGLFSPARNYHVQANDAKDAREWVELIKKEARIDEEEEELALGSPIENKDGYHNIGDILRSSVEQDDSEHDRLGSSSPEPPELSRHPTTKDRIQIPGSQNIPLPEFEYSGNEHGSYSDFSDTAPARIYGQSLSLSNSKMRAAAVSNPGGIAKDPSVPKKSESTRNTSQASGFQVDQDEEREIWHGYLLCLKSKGGVRQWKKLWVVLRPKHLAFYKNEEEYSAHLLIPLSNIISAVEIDPVSRSKAHCMQIIAEDRSYRFCAPSEDALARWLGAVKSQLARRKENTLKKASAA